MYSTVQKYTELSILIINIQANETEIVKMNIGGTEVFL